MKEIAELFVQLGPNVALIVVLLYWVFFLQRKLISIIENNTTAMTATKQTLENINIAISDCHSNRSRRT